MKLSHAYARVTEFWVKYLSLGDDAMGAEPFQVRIHFVGGRVRT